jgi:hypothetical protein
VESCQVSSIFNGPVGFAFASVFVFKADGERERLRERKKEKEHGGTAGSDRSFWCADLDSVALY